MYVIRAIKEEIKMAFDNVTNNRKIGVIIRRLANGWYDDIYKGEQRKTEAIAVLKEEGIWNLLSFKDEYEEAKTYDSMIFYRRTRKRGI